MPFLIDFCLVVINMKNLLKKYFGDKQFYKTVFQIITPIMLQQLLLSLAGYVDNLMINSYGGIGDYSAYNGVSAANRIIFVLNFTALGIAATASIFISQYFGANNKDKVQESFRLSLIFAVAFGIVSFLIIEFFGHAIVDTYLQDASARNFGYRYLDVIKWATTIQCLVMAFANALRSVKHTIEPMLAGFAGIAVNVLLNYLLIFGHWGLPEMDSAGAALATLISRLVELVILMAITLCSTDSWFKGCLKRWKFDKQLVSSFVKKGVPLVANEILWSLGNVLFVLFYCWQNDVWYNAYAYAQNISDLFFIAFAGLGNGTAVLVGSALGSGDFERAVDNCNKLKGLGLVMGLGLGALMAATSPLTVLLFQPDQETKSMVISILCIVAVFLAIYSYNTVNFFVLRSGGDSLRAFILDQIPTYAIGIPLAILFGVNASSWGLALPFVFSITHISDIIKIFIGDKFVAKGKWIVNLTVKK